MLLMTNFKAELSHCKIIFVCHYHLKSFSFGSKLCGFECEWKFHELNISVLYTLFMTLLVIVSDTEISHQKGFFTF